MRIDHKLPVLALFLSFLMACHSSTDKRQTYGKRKADTTDVVKPAFVAAKIPLDFNGFWVYYTKSIKLYEDFVSHDLAGKIMDKADFLAQMKTERYLPLLLGSNDVMPHYQLVQIPKNADPNIGTYMRQFAADELKFGELKGKPIPEFNFKDINGKQYTSANTKGKVVLFKCWFIGCTACVQEMPALNELVKKYKERKDILFISLASDSKADLQAFLSKTKFDYATVPLQDRYMTEQLRVNAYPTHFLINKKGVLVNVVSDETAIADLLAREIAKN